MINLWIHICVETIFLRRCFHPGSQGLLVRQTNLSDRLHALEAILPWRHQPPWRPIRIGKRLSVNTRYDESQRVHRFIQPQALRVWPMQNTSAEEGLFFVRIVRTTLGFALSYSGGRGRHTTL